MESMNEKEGIMETESVKLKIEAICQERNGLRLEIIEMEKSMHRCLFAFIAVSIGIIGLYYEPAIITDESTRAMLIFVIIQVEVLLSVFGICLISNQNIHAGYINALEHKINLLLDDQVNIWESEITKNYLFKLRGSFVWCVTFLCILLSAIYIMGITIAYSNINRMVYGIILALEFIAIVVLLIVTSLDQKRVSKIAMDKLNIK